MAPGGEMFRYPQHFGESVLRHGSHEWLPYSVDEVRLKSSNNNLSFFFIPKGFLGYYLIALIFYLLSIHTHRPCRGAAGAEGINTGWG